VGLAKAQLWFNVQVHGGSLMNKNNVTRSHLVLDLGRYITNKTYDNFNDFINQGVAQSILAEQNPLHWFTYYIVNLEKGMKKLASLCAGLLLCFSAGVFAEEHAEAALEHAKAAVVHGKAGHASVLVEHAETALLHAQKSAMEVTGEYKTHMEAAVKSLKEAIEHGKMGHAEMATKPAEEAVEHIKAGNMPKHEGH